MNKLEEVKSIMKEYEERSNEVETKYTQSDIEIKRLEMHIERLKENLSEVDTSSLTSIQVKSLMEEYQGQIRESEAEKEKLTKEFNVTKNLNDKSKKQEQMELDDKVRRDLTQEIKSIEGEIEVSKAKMQVTLAYMNAFKYEYDENHIATNGGEFKKLNDEYEELKSNMAELVEAKKMCEDKLEEFRQKDNKSVEKINEILQRSGEVVKSTELETEEEKSEEVEVEEPEAEEPEAEEPEAEEPEAEEPEAEEPETEEPEAEEPEAEEPETEEPEAEGPEAEEPEAEEPEAEEPETEEPEAEEPEAEEPETEEPEAEEPETEEPEAEEPEAEEPEAEEPEAEEPEAEEPEAEGPESEEPEAEGPEAEEVEAEEPEAEKAKKTKKEINPEAKKVKILYNAKEDLYMVKDIETGESVWINRKDIKETNKELLAEKTGKNIENLEYVDTNILRILMNYNKNLAKKYYKETTTMGKSKKDRMRCMKEEVGVEIDYDLRGLYDKFPGDELDSKPVNAFSLEERRELLDNANKATDNGFGKCKKGLKVLFFEKVDQVRRRFTMQNLLDMGKVKGYDEEKSENFGREDKKKQRGLRKLRTKEVVNEPYGLQPDVLDKLEGIKQRVKIDDETKEKLDEVVEQHKEEETKTEEPHSLTPDEYHKQEQELIEELKRSFKEDFKKEMLKEKQNEVVEPEVER